MDPRTFQLIIQVLLWEITLLGIELAILRILERKEARRRIREQEKEALEYLKEWDKCEKRP